jgi:hypothetical protein
MAKKSIGATLSLNNGNFFTNIKSAITGTNSLKSATTNATGNLKKMSSESVSLGSSLGSMAKKALGAAAAYVSFNAAKDFLVDCVKSANEAEQANVRFETTMRNVKGTTQAQIDAIKEYASELQNTTVIEGDAAVAGASQLAAFQLSGDAVKKLMPALADLSVAQNGVNATGEQMQTTASMIGKAMSGSATALKKAGVILTDSQQAILKNGTEAQKTQVIVDALGKTYGGLARKMAETPEGRIIQLKNAFGDMKEEIGGALYPIMTNALGWLAGKIPAIQNMLTTALGGVSTALSYITITVLPPITTAFSAVWSWGVSAFENIRTAVINNAPAFDGVKSAALDLKDKLFQAFEYCKPTINWVKDTGLPAVANIIGGVLTAATGVYNFFVNNWSAIAPIIAGIAGALLAYKTAVGIVNAVELVRKGVTVAITAVQWLLNAAMSANPIGIIIVAIGALIAIGVALWLNWDSVCSWLGGVWEGIKNTAVAVWNAISQFFVDWWPYIFAVFTGGISLIVGFVVNNWDSIKNTTVTVFNSVKDTVINIWNGIVNGIKGAVNLIIGAINGLIRGFVNGINGLISGVNTVTGAIGIPAIPTFTAPQIPMLAEGGYLRAGGRVVVGERGAEILDLPKGASVTPLDRAGKSENTFNINIYAGGKSGEEIISDLIPKLKLALANL